ncbi:uncharacterized protein BJ171DRAFT_514503 [Polychytrium aggregatum]|uniref:uncharacterized protein n=1 Tax=Polychytrium aggregatum TaxID=110093 RepID=UPI0022FEC851|nr:uncharacterized protein BJ171DRAFT_514503 [Polychytrium aggregatum]KAI9202513.1 hypothetical protein BJ171DRAFT_514503 [Polychytrium aggregatum]
MVCWLESLLYSCILAKARCNSHSIQFHIDCDTLAPACCTEHHQFASKPSFPHRNMLTEATKVAQAIVLHHKDCNRLQMGVYQGTPCSYQASPRCLLFDRLYGPR